MASARSGPTPRTEPRPNRTTGWAPTTPSSGYGPDAATASTTPSAPAPIPDAPIPDAPIPAPASASDGPGVPAAATERPAGGWRSLAAVRPPPAQATSSSSPSVPDPGDSSTAPAPERLRSGVAT